MQDTKPLFMQTDPKLETVLNKLLFLHETKTMTPSEVEVVCRYE
jgi:hypothetical protein